MDIEWKKGVFHKFIAGMTIRVGYSTIKEIRKNTEFEFDGLYCKYNGQVFKQPGIRGAVAQDWMVCMDKKKNWREGRTETRVVSFFFTPGVVDGMTEYAKKLGVSRQSLMKYALLTGITELKKMKANEIKDKIRVFMETPVGKRFN